MKFVKFLLNWIGLMLVGVASMGAAWGLVWFAFIATDIARIVFSVGVTLAFLTLIGFVVVTFVREVFFGRPPKIW